MARMYPHQALDQLIYAPTTPTAAQFAQLAAMTSSGAELNLLDGLNAAGSATASKVVTLDANSAVSGIRRKVLVDADGAAGIDAAYSGYIITNEGATGAATFVLSAAAVGVELTFMVMTAQELRIDPSGTQTIALPSTGCLLYTSDAADE